jgi:hypothetical protein
VATSRDNNVFDSKISRQIPVFHRIILGLIAVTALHCGAPKPPKHVTTNTTRLSSPEPIPTLTTPSSKLPAATTSPTPPPDNERSCRPFGPEGPVLLGASAPDGRWSIFCDLHTPSTPIASLAIGTKVFHPITALLGSSRDGRYIVIANHKQTTFLDTQTNTQQSLDAFGLVPEHTFTENRPLGLDVHPEKPLVIFVSEVDHQRNLIVFDLSKKLTTILAPLPNVTVKIRWSTTSEAIIVDELSSVSLLNPTDLTTVDTPCQFPEPRMWVSAARPRLLKRYVVALREPKLVEVPGLLLDTPNGTVEMTETRRITLRSGRETRTLSPKDCEANVLGIHPSTASLLVGCTKEGRMHLGIAFAQGFVPLELDIPTAYDLDNRNIASRYLPIYSGAKSDLIDFESRRTIALHDKDQLLAQSGTYVLIKRDLSVLRLDLSTMTEDVVLMKVAPGARLQMSPGFAYVAPYVVSAEPTELPTPFQPPQYVLRIAPGGCALVGNPPTDRTLYVTGPLRWVCPDNPRDDVKALSNARTVINRPSGSTARACSAQ